jgi:hypothetical protein
MTDQVRRLQPVRGVVTTVVYVGCATCVHLQKSPDELRCERPNGPVFDLRWDSGVWETSCHFKFTDRRLRGPKVRRVRDLDKEESHD